ncbi:MAG: RIP metalloprotease RseP, partial [Burkholderiales bacterium]|nr:RIP metalloprotease RseP [Burkholderiales bacterium]
MSLVHTLVWFIVALAALIVVHEYGHYLVARLCGVRVLRFSVGFGRPLVSRRFKPSGTEWVIAALPIGGYVKMLDEREGLVSAEEAHRAFNRQGVGKRIAIVGAGPLANFLLAIVLYWLLFVSGVPDSRPVIGTPPAHTPAAAAGLQRGDRIERIDAKRVESWQDARWQLLQLALARAQARLEVVDRAGHLSLKTLDLRGFELEDVEGDPVARAGILLYRPSAVIGRVLPGGVAERAGLKQGDRILAVDSRAIESWDEFVLAVRSHPGETMRLRIADGAGEYAIEMKPEPVTVRGRTIGRIGAEPRASAEESQWLMIEVRHGPWKALVLAAAKTWETSIFSLRMIGRMIVGDISWRNLSGPVTIADYAGQSAQAGWSAYLAFLAIISISLGVLNLLPIPLLDGGHLLYYLAEILKGGPLSERAMEIGQQIGLALLVLLMAFA